MPSSLGVSLSWAIFPENIITGDVIIAAIEIKLSPRRSCTSKTRAESLIFSSIYIINYLSDPN